MSKTKKLILTALLLAMLVVLSRFLSLRTPLIKISFGFIPTMLCAAWLGWKWTMLLNFLGDIIGATFFPSGPFFIGYTISTVLAGLIYGLLLYRGNSTKLYVWRVILATVLVTVIVNMGLNTLWTAITAGKAFWPLLVTRIGKQFIMVPIHIIVFLALEKLLRPLYTKYLLTDDLNDDVASS